MYFGFGIVLKRSLILPHHSRSSRGSVIKKQGLFSLSLSLSISPSLSLFHIDLVKAEISDAKPKQQQLFLENGNLKLLPAVAYFAAHDVLSELPPCPSLSLPLFLSACCLFHLQAAKKLGVKTKFVHKAIHFKKACHKKNYQAKVEKELFDNMAAAHAHTHTLTHTHTHRHT